MKTTTEYWRGRFGREEGVSLHHNPHEPGTEKHSQWDAGWNSGTSPQKEPSPVRKILVAICTYCGKREKACPSCK